MHNPGSPSTLSQYGEAANVPLIKSPSLRVPKLVQLPPDIHPLPDSVSAYFVYPFTLENHLLSLEATRQQTLAAHATQRAAYLAGREAEKERRRAEMERVRTEVEEKKKREERERLWKVAPGFDAESGPLVPKKLGQETKVGSSSGGGGGAMVSNGSTAAVKDPMLDLVEQLAKLDAAHSHP